jgi:hypothetical protein
MKMLRTFLATVSLICGFSAVAYALPATAETEVRATVQKVFQDLRSKNYDALYDNLPANFRTRISREKFTTGLRRSQDTYALDRIEIGKVKASGDIAAADTVLYGRLLKPFDTEGKIMAQQYQVRENGKWKVATGDNTTIRKFLDANPAFARQFPIRQPRLFVKKEGGWVEFTMPRRTR